MPKNESSARPAARASLARVLCSITDPFCPAAKGARIPDGLGGASMALQLRGNIAFSTSATGAQLVCFQAGAPYGWIGATLSTGVWTFASTYNLYAQSGILTTYGSRYRIVSAGVVLRSTVSMTNAQGYVIVSDGSPPGPSTSVNAGDIAYPRSQTLSLTQGFQHMWRSTPQGAIARQYQSLLGNTNINSGMSALFIEVIGGPASLPVMVAEYFINVEFQLSPDSGVAQMAPPPTRANPAAMSIASKVHESANNLLAGGVEQMEVAVQSAASKAIMAAETAGSDFLTGALSFLGL